MHCPLRRAIEQRIEDPLSEELLRGAFEGKDTIVIDAFKNDEGKITRLNFEGDVRGLPEPPEPVSAGVGEGEESDDNGGK